MCLYGHFKVVSSFSENETISILKSAINLQASSAIVNAVYSTFARIPSTLRAYGSLIDLKTIQRKNNKSVHLTALTALFK